MMDHQQMMLKLKYVRKELTFSSDEKRSYIKKLQLFSTIHTKLFINT